MHGLVICGATVVGGLGGEPKRADVAVQGGRIASIGPASPSDAEAAAHLVDGEGLALAPGIVDLHTHCEAQITWHPTLSP